MQSREMRCDVLVIGAGAAGMRAAIAAQEKGARVILAVKGKIGLSGASTFQVTEAGGYGAADGRRCPEDNPDIHMQDILTAAHGMAIPEVVRTLVANAPESVRELEGYGVQFEKERGGYLITQGCFGSIPRNYNLRGLGTQIVTCLAGHLDAERVMVLEETMIVHLLVDGGRCHGAVGLSKAGEILFLRAGAVVLAGGGAGQLFRFALNPGEITGDSYALGYRAGAELMNLEFMQVGMGILAPGFSILNSWIWSLHPTLLDAKGNAVLEGILPTGVMPEAVMDAKSTHYPFSSESLSKYLEIGMQKAIAEGRGGPHGGVLLDARTALQHKSGSRLQLFEDMWRMTNEWYLSHGIDAARDVLEIACFAHAINGGLKINPKARTSIAGLYAAGEAASGPHGADRLGGNMLPNCVVYGKIAGEQAALEARGLDAPSAGDFGFEPLFSGGKGIPAAELRQTLQKHMFADMMVLRSGEKCTHFRHMLREWKASAQEAAIPDAQPWTPYELSDMSTTAALMMEAIERRRESRGSHYREDFPAEAPALDAPFVFTRETLPVD